MYSLSTLVPMTWKVKYPGMMTATIVKIKGDKSIKIDVNKRKAESKISKIDGLRVVFYWMTLSWGNESISLSCKYDESC